MKFSKKENFKILFNAPFIIIIITIIIIIIIFIIIILFIIYLFIYLSIFFFLANGQILSINLKWSFYVFGVCSRWL